LLEQNVDIRVIQVLLGHAKLETTALYTRVAVNTIRDVTSPLERLGVNLTGRSPPTWTRRTDAAIGVSCGIPYDSDEGRAICGALSAVLTGRAYATSAEIAGKSGAFPGYKPNAEAMLRVIRNHKRAADGEVFGYESLSVAPTPLDHVSLAKAGPAFDHLGDAARAAWSAALALGQTHGYRNAQVSVVAPTGTIGLVMDCDTTGIEPDFALVKFKKLAGGGYFKIINRAVPDACGSASRRTPSTATARNSLSP
jgi:ribonucleoside-diphosphate reductase alpha chain